MANPLTDTISTVITSARGPATASTGSGFNTWIVVSLFFGSIALVSIVGAVIWFYYSEKNKWTITTRCHYENPTINGVTIGNAVKTKRIRFKDGRVVYMYKTPIQGYTISPELLTWSRPREHDLVITQDKKVFCIVGLGPIDAQRKKLGVDVSYPDIEMDRQDLQQFIDSKKFDDPNDRLKMILRAGLWAFVIISVIILVILGGKTYIDAKNIDASRDQTNFQTAKVQYQVMNQMNTFVLIMSKVMPQSFKAIDGQNLLNQTLTQ